MAVIHSFTAANALCVHLQSVVNVINRILIPHGFNGTRSQL